MMLLTSVAYLLLIFWRLWRFPNELASSDLPGGWDKRIAP
jgi:hypothetical protein